MQVLNDITRNNSVKHCARYLIFVSKRPVECPLEHAIKNSNMIFAIRKVPFVTSRHI